LKAKYIEEEREKVERGKTPFYLSKRALHEVFLSLSLFVLGVLDPISDWGIHQRDRELDEELNCLIMNLLQMEMKETYKDLKKR
jgi:hypothetical protein